MDSDDPVGSKFRSGKKVINIPVNGSQKIEIKNITEEEVSLEAFLFSSRFNILNTRKTSFPDIDEFKVALPPDNSIVIEIKDNGHVDMDKIRPTYSFEGVFSVTVKEISQSILLNTDPETESYKELRLYRDRHADCKIWKLHNGEVEKFVSIEPIAEDKYGKTLPNNVKTLKLSADDEKYNKKRDVLNRIEAVDRCLDSSEFRREMDRIMENYEKDRKAQQQSRPVSAAPQPKRSEKSEKSEAKSMSENPKSTLKSEKTTRSESAAPESKRSVTSEKSEAKSMSENPKSTMKSEKTTKSEFVAPQSKRSVTSEKSVAQDSKSTIKSEKTTTSEMVQKSEKFDLPELKNQEKKKKKKKKRCVIS